MDEPIDFSAVAAQLARPEGEAGIKAAEQMNTSNAEMTKHTIDLLALKGREIVLEIGPGNGRFAEYVLSKGPGIQYTGVDISATMVQTARQINGHLIDAGQADFIQVDGQHLPFPESTFTHVFTVNTLYFWENPAVQLAETKRILTPGGTFCLAIASKAFMKQLPFTAYGFTLYTPETAQQLLLANGFALVDTTVRAHKTVSASKQEVMREEIFIRCQRPAHT
ncbi:class I SAM-dependent methyltransferase [Parapedobacter sp. ISTM3]|uniref:Methyltransferase domain-containing protein n=1 Tax=Parapedobacter luteus TaxID=623280 RepID=A0A1T5A114_9SPHI|nr:MULTISPECIES: class I SAM-dependent methyltransferase [Parapedobacter]MBK1440025.1 class I SAM-dependent methyltransferase [Parapedobacter sp. ISTM3]SKB28721.1 Methyltransferase domain-containing protein [Parapedobacter luteus]